MINIDKFGIYDPDSSEWTWDNFYNKTYRTLGCWKKLDKEKQDGGYKRAFYTYNNTDKIQIGGDVIFNFKDGYGYSFRKLLGNQFNEKAYDMMHYSVLNFSFMPTTGGLNLIKTNGAYGDRLDRLIFYLDQLIQSKESEGNPLIKIRGNNKLTVQKLAKYFTSFNSIEEYCHAYYLLDSNKTNLVYEFIDLGKKYVDNNEIPTAEYCKKYLELVSEFWKYRNNIFKKEYGLDICSLDDGIDINTMNI